MQFDLVKLTKVNGKPLFIDPTLIIYVTEDDYSWTVIGIEGNKEFTVRESCEEVLTIIEEYNQKLDDFHKEDWQK